MLIFPNAKINIGLNILSKRDDGYHNIDSLFYPVPLYDIIEIIPLDKDNSSGNSFINTGTDLNLTVGNNICLKAATIMQSRYKIPPVSIHLHKVIPHGAGLGGGSSDAAFILMGLNQLFKLDLDDTTLEDIASLIGSDCPFFIRNRPVIAIDRGFTFESSDLDLTGVNIVVIHPKITISTKDAYNLIVPKTPKKSISDLVSANITDWAKWLKNDFELPVLKVYPKLSGIKEFLLSEGAFYASMSGSGSAIYGLFSENKDSGIFEKRYPGMFIWNGVL